MSGDQWTEQRLHTALSRAFDGEPPMGSGPAGDLHRGRRLLRRRRIGGGAASVVALVPVAALLATGIGPAGTGSQGSDSDTPATQDTDCQDLRGVTGEITGEADVAERGRNGAGGRSTVLHPDQAVDGTECPTAGAESWDTSGVDRVQNTMIEALDPSGDHMDAFLSSIGSTAAAVAGDGGGTGDGSTDATPVSNISSTGRWHAGDTVGGASVSVFGPDDPTTRGPGCADPSSEGGPELACERRTLTDGSTVTVGQGSRRDATRLTVSYVRPDGEVVFATSDQATSDWWADGSGPSPLAQSPATVAQLIDLVREPAMHL